MRSAHLSLPTDQPVLLRNWLAKALRGTHQAAINAEKLVNGETIVRSTKRRITFLHLLFDAPQIIYANGLEVIVERERVASLTK
ncbi:Hint domain-containing protein [Nereida sp.]|uniref:Hint domain-containing protein n=1 Tax=Nereida sp. TaxID=2736090 RepID=UPI003F69575E